MQDEKEKRSIEVARIIERTAANLMNSETLEINASFDNAEVRSLLLVKSSEEKLEVRRRILEWKIRLCCDRGLALVQVKCLHDQLINLGYSNIGIEVSTETCYARYLINTGETALAINVLKRLIENLVSVSSDVDQDWYEQVLNYSKKLIGKAETKDSKSKPSLES